MLELMTTWSSLSILQELSARIRALLRRGEATAKPILEWGKLRLDPSIMTVQYADTPIELSPKEYQLLELFPAPSPPGLQPRPTAGSALVLRELPPKKLPLRLTCRGLRQKLKAAGAPGDVIETV